MTLPDWNIENYLPLLTSRDILITMEILQFGIKYPNQLIYKNKFHTIYAKEFRDSILNEFTSILFQDLCFYLKPRSLLIKSINEEMIKRLTQSFYSDKELSAGYQWLDMSIMLYCSINHPDIFKIDDQTIQWNLVQRLHWKLYFAKFMIQYL